MSNFKQLVAPKVEREAACPAALQVGIGKRKEGYFSGAAWVRR